jgi:tetratricopeptide (TPR) repeat protein
LDEVAKAFAIDPLNPTLQELEERLQREFTEFRDQQRLAAEQEQKETVVRGRITFARDLMANGAFEEALAEVAGGLAEFPQHADLVSLEAEIRTAYDEWLRVRTNQERETQIQEYVTAAQGYLVRGEFPQALQEVTKALVLDPASSDLRQLETQIEDARALSVKRAQDAECDKKIEQHVFHAKEFKFHRMFEEAVGELDAALALDDTREDVRALRVEFVELYERWKQDKSARELEGAVAHHVQQTRALLDADKLDEALIEIMMGIALAPDNADLLALERDVNDRQAALASANGQESTEAGGLAPEDNERLIRIHLRAAAQYQEQKEYAKALDEIAKAFAIDPTHKETKRLEVRIRQQYAGNEQTLRLVVPTNRAAGEATG